MRCSTSLLILLSLPLYTSPLQLPSVNPFQGASNFIRRQQLGDLVSTRLGAGTPTTFVPDGTSAAGSMAALWSWVLEESSEASSSSSSRGSVLAFPDARGKDCSRFVAALEEAAPILDASGTEELVFRRLTQDDNYMGAVVAERRRAAAERAGDSSDDSTTTSSGRRSVDAAAARGRMKKWVERTLVRYGMCPFTGSAEVSGVRLEEFGVEAAPIRYLETGAATLPELLAEFWAAADAMVADGDGAVSSIVMSCPAWDARWASWQEDVFPVLEECVVASGLGRTLGVVCFHPNYATPAEAFLRKHRFGHMYSPRKLMGWVESSGDDALAGGVTLPQLQWAGSCKVTPICPTPE